MQTIKTRVSRRNWRPSACSAFVQPTHASPRRNAGPSKGGTDVRRGVRQSTNRTTHNSVWLYALFTYIPKGRDSCKSLEKMFVFFSLKTKHKITIYIKLLLLLLYENMDKWKRNNVGTTIKKKLYLEFRYFDWLCILYTR